MDRVLASLGCLMTLLWATNAFALTISGTVTDAAGPPGAAVGGVRVTIYNENIFPIPDFEVDDVFANAVGFYSTTNAAAGEDIYVIAKWEWRIPISPNKSVVRLLDCTGCAPSVASFLSKRQPLTGSIGNITSNQTINVTMDQIQPPNLPNLETRVNHLLSFMGANAPPSWSANYDIPIRLTGGAAFASEEVNVSVASLTASTFDWVTLYHELGHKIHWEANNNSLPPIGAACGVHTRNSEETKECALVEGWATYLGQRAAEMAGAGAVADPFYTAYRDPGNNLWRGDEAVPTGRDGPTWESGENVEGAVAAVMFATDPTLSFAGNFRVLDEDNPDSLFKFFRGQVSRAGGSGTPATLAITAFLQTHGVVLSRARFRSGLSNIFDENSPPNDAASVEDGNVKLISSAVFVRGNLTVNLEDVPAVDLGVSDRINVSEIRVGWGPATDSTAGGPGAITGFTPFAGFGFFNDDVELDTKTMGGTSGDGDWDLLAVSKNNDGFTDNFLPTWVGDSNATVNQDELYLKVLGSWFDVDRDPSTDTIRGGKVIVDNTPPKPDATSFKPQ